MDRLKPALSVPSPEFRFALPLRVRMADTDAQAIVYHATYLAYCEAGRVEYMRELDLDYLELMVNVGLEMAVSKAGQTYHAPARFDDIVDVWVRVSQIRRVTITYAYELRCRRTNALLVAATTKIACIKRATRRPARMPQLLLDTLRDFEGAALDDRSGRRKVLT